MNHLQELAKQLDAVDAKIDALLQHDEMTEDQRAEHDDLVDERKAVAAKIDAEKNRLQRAAERQKLAAELAEQEKREVVAEERTARVAGSGRITTPERTRLPAVAAAKKVRLADGREVEEQWLLDPRKGFSTHLDFLKAVMHAGMGDRQDPRLKNLARTSRLSDGDQDEREVRGSDFIVPFAFAPTTPSHLSMLGMPSRQATAGSDEHGVYSDPYGGFAVRKGFRAEMLRISPEGDPMGAFTTKIPMDVPSVEIPARVDKNHTTSVSGGLRVYRRAETLTVASSRMEGELIELKAAALFGVAYATEELLARSLISFLAIIQSGFSDEFNSKLIRERLEGTGVGQFEGVLNTPCLVSQAAEAGQAADTILFENVVKMRSRCWRYGGAIWLANHDTLPQLMLMNQTVGTGGVPVWQPSAREDHPDMLLGRPLYFTEYCPKVGDAGDLLLGNWAEYLEGTLSPLQSAESVHVRFLEHERTFKFWMENAGRCWWRSALTPAKSSVTLSPFVSLAAR